MQDILDLSTDKSLTGFRLYRMEVLNWGTFDRKVWKIEPYGFNSLLTGDIGSGKSTLVDAITSLLVPHQKIVYNKAAGADSKERSLFTYIRGEYKKKKSEWDSSSKSVFLRTENDYSVLLAYFYNEGYSQGVTLAQVFWNRNEKIEKFFVVSNSELGIIEHFRLNDEEKDIYPLKKRLKSLNGVSVFESFSDYNSKFRNIFGIKSDKALDLFYQTVSMKSIGSLNEFVRNHMLERPDIKTKIEELRKNYENLTKAYSAVQNAKRQLDQLEPLVQEADSYEGLTKEIAGFQQCLNALPVYFAVHKSALIEEAIKNLGSELEAIQNCLTDMNQDIERLRDHEKALHSAIEFNQEGRRIAEIERQIKDLENSKTKKFESYEQYKRLVSDLELSQTINEETFYQVLQKADDLKVWIEGELKALIEKRDGLKIQHKNLTDACNQDKAELKSLKQRKTQIPDANLRIRQMMLEDLGLDESGLPFVGELLMIKSNEKEWEGAIERLLHNFGLSVLVPEVLYKRVSNYVEKTNLKGRLVYFKVPDSPKGIKGHRIQKDVSEKSLFNKIEIKPDTAFYDWLEHEIRENFDYICCDDIEQFQREPRAISINGQIKGGRLKHEKDDRKSISDRRFYVLGWSNHEKIKAIEKEIARIENQIRKTDNDIKDVEKQQQRLNTQKINLHDLIKFRDFADINWQKDASEIEKLRAQIVELEKSSEQLRSLKRQLAEVQKDIKSKEESQKSKTESMGKIKGRIEDYERQIKACKQVSILMTEDEQNAVFPKIEDILHGRELTIETADRIQQEIRKSVEDVRDSKRALKERFGQGIISKMQRYKMDYPAETIEVDASIDAISEFRQFYDRIKEEDLPRHENRFKELLNKGTINDIAMFKNQLEVMSNAIEDRIRHINESLKEIEYNPGTYIKLLAERTQDIEIKEFKLQMRGCLENILGDTEIYTEEKFNKVKQILDRFQSGEQTDINWTAKVTDVRNWFEFSASERWSADNTEKEFYSDSSGKSGGQKEKLAYTILASALAYQFGLDWSGTKSRSFRFVVLDEAFGRGSDESARYGLELFKRLNLQLLIVTPLQKVTIIENYIKAVHLASNENGDNSVVRNLTIQEYMEEKETYLGSSNFCAASSRQ
jgi:uncharacterized protein YPO0396